MISEKTDKKLDINSKEYGDKKQIFCLLLFCMHLLIQKILPYQTW